MFQNRHNVGLSRDFMVANRRMGAAPIPTDLGQYLNDLQMSALREVEDRGWSLKYVRRPVFQTPSVVLVSRDGAALALLEEDGSLNLHAEIRERGSTGPKPNKYLV